MGSHALGVKATGKGLGAADHFHYAPGLKQVYVAAEKRAFDPYDIGMAVIRAFLEGALLDRPRHRLVLSSFTVRVVKAFSWLVRKPHNGTHWMYILWALGGAVLVGVIFLGVF